MIFNAWLLRYSYIRIFQIVEYCITMTCMQNFSTSNQTIGQYIHALRLQKPLTGIQLAALANISQSKLSKLETDSIKAPRFEDVYRLLTALGASERQHQKARWLMGHPRSNFVEALPVSHNFESTFTQENRSVSIQLFSLAMPALLQTVAYQAGVLDRMVLTYRQRSTAQKFLQQRQDNLWDPNRRYHIVMYESALYTVAAGYKQQVAQIDRIERMLNAPALTIGIIPFVAGLPADDPCSFILYDGSDGYYEYMGNDVAIRQSRDLDYAVSRFGALASSADYGQDVLVLLQRAKRYFDSLPNDRSVLRAD